MECSGVQGCKYTADSDGSLCEHALRVPRLLKLLGVSSRHIHNMVPSKANAIRQLLAPSCPGSPTISDNTSAASIKGTAALHDFAGKKDAATNQTALFPRWSLPLLSWMRADAEACRGFFLGEKQTSRAGNLLPGVKVQIAA